MTENEISLMDLLRVIWKWKWLIIVGTLICAAAAVVYSYKLPKVYKVDMLIEPGIIKVNAEKEELMYLDAPENISRKINQGAYNQRIMKLLNMNPKEVRLGFTANMESNGKSQIIQVSSEWEEKKQVLGIDVLKCLLDLLTNDYGAIVQQKKLNYDARITNNKNKIHDIKVQRKDLEKQIQIKASDIKSRKNQIKIKQARLEDVRQRIEKLLLELKQVKENAEKITEKRNKLINKNNAQDDISLMLYGTTLQQNIIYFNELNSQIYNLRNEQNHIESQIDSFEREINNMLGEIERLRLHKDEGVQIKIDNIKTEIQRLQAEKQIISNIKTVKTPEVSLHPIRPKKKQIVALTGVAALFMFIFLGFFIEYIKKRIKRIKKRGVSGLRCHVSG